MYRARLLHLALQQLGDIRRDPPRFVLRQQLRRPGSPDRPEYQRQKDHRDNKQTHHGDHEV